MNKLINGTNVMQPPCYCLLEKNKEREQEEGTFLSSFDWNENMVMIMKRWFCLKHKAKNSKKCLWSKRWAKLHIFKSVLFLYKAPNLRFRVKDNFIAHQIEHGPISWNVTWSCFSVSCPSMFCCVLLVEDARMTINQGGKGKPIYFLALLAENPNINGKTLSEHMLSKIGILLRR